MQRWLSCPSCPKHLSPVLSLNVNSLPFVWWWYYLCSAVWYSRAAVWDLLVVSESFGWNGWKMRKQLAERCLYSQGSWRTVKTLCFPVPPCAPACRGIVYFQWLFLVPAETRPAYTWTLGGSRCALYAATKPNKPVCIGFHITDCVESCKIQMMSNGHLPIQATSCVCECDTWV